MDVEPESALRVGPSSVCLVLQGDIDVSSVENYRGRVSDVIAKRPQTILVDLAHVSFMDSSGLGLLADLARASREWGGSVYVMNAVDIVQTAVRACGLDQFVALVDSDDPRVVDSPVGGSDPSS